MKMPEKRDKISQAALDLIAEQGFHGAPMALIAEKAGVGAGTIYRYFASKDILITKLFRELEEKIVASLAEGYSEEKPFRERFIYLCTRLVKYFVTNPIHFRFMEQYFNSPYGVSLRRDKITGASGDQSAFTCLFQQGIEQQVLKDLPFFVLAALTFSPLVSLARDHTLNLIELDDALILKSIEACWDGIKR